MHCRGKHRATIIRRRAESPPGLDSPEESSEQGLGAGASPRRRRALPASENHPRAFAHSMTTIRRRAHRARRHTEQCRHLRAKNFGIRHELRAANPCIRAVSWSFRCRRKKITGLNRLIFTSTTSKALACVF